MAKAKVLKKDELVQKIKEGSTIQQLADEYGMCYQTMFNYLKDNNIETGKVGRPKKLIIE